MLRYQALTALLVAGAAFAQTEPFSGAAALEQTRHIVAFGPRPDGSAALARTRAYILERLKAYKCTLSEDRFTADTPNGKLPMSNLIARFAGSSGQSVVISGHYDTKWMPSVRFVGANDGGASAGFLLEMARVLSGRPLRHEVVLVWFDGEEAFKEWSDRDGKYGSRHLAEKWQRDGTLRRVRGLINVDMIGDRDLAIQREYNSSKWLTELVWQTARDIGYGAFFRSDVFAIDDDHMPFVERKVEALDLIDFNYGPQNSWWHTAQDTVDKLSPASFEVLGRVLVEAAGRIR